MLEKINKETKMAAETFDTGKLAELVRLAIGGRSLSSFAEEAGVSKSYVSKIINGKISPDSPPSRKVLSKLANPEKAAPQNGITLADLFTSCGYSTAELEDGEEDFEMPAVCSTVQKYYNNALPMAAVSVLMNGLVLNGVTDLMAIETKGSYFEIHTPDSDEAYVGIPVFCQKQDAFNLMYMAALSILLVLSNKDATFYILTDNRELYQFLIDRIKVPKEMRVSVLYTEDHVFIKEETRIGGNQDEWFPKSIMNTPETIITTE